MRPHLCVVILLALATLIGGCGSSDYEVAPVTGTLTCNGTPISGGVIWFTPVAGSTSSGSESLPGKVGRARIQPDGTFEVSTYSEGDGAIVGQHNLRFDPPARLTRDDLAGLSPEEQEEMKAASKPIPDECSGRLNLRTVLVGASAADNHFDFTLEPREANEPPPAVDD